MKLAASSVSDLESLPKEHLHNLWQKTFKQAPSPRLRREIMLPVLAYRLQELSNPSPTQDDRMLLVQAMKTVKTSEADPNRRFRAGTRMVREWKGQVHEVLAKEDGFEYRGEHFKSLSPIACRITGTRWSGPAFFGTKGKK